MYEKGYNRFIWGLVFLTIDIDIDFINIFPDFIGYILIYSGLDILTPQQKLFERGKIPAIILTILTLKDIWHDPNNNILTGQLVSLGLPSMLLSSAVIIIRIYLIYVICDAIYKLCEERGLDDLMNMTIAPWKFYFGISVIYLFFLPCSLNLTIEVKIAAFLFIGFVQICISIFMAQLFAKCKSELQK